MFELTIYGFFAGWCFAALALLGGWCAGVLRGRGHSLTSPGMPPPRLDDHQPVSSGQCHQ